VKGPLVENSNFPHSTIFTSDFSVIFVECFIPEVLDRNYTFNSQSFHIIVEEKVSDEKSKKIAGFPSQRNFP
jgi:hypothetical protein